jgi:hypothetical protein
MAFIICFFQFLLIVKNEAFDLSQIMRSYASVACKKNGRLQPEFAVSVRRPDVDMRRLASLVGVEVRKMVCPAYCRFFTKAKTDKNCSEMN